MKNLIINILSILLLLVSCTKNTKETSSLEIKKDSIFKRIYKKAKHKEALYQHDSAYVYYYNYLSKAKEFNDTIRIARGYFNLSRLDYFHSDYKSSQQNAIQSLQYLKGYEDESLYAVCLNVLGLTLKATANHEESIYYYNKYRACYLEKKDTLDDFIVFQNNMGNVYQESGDYIKSIDYYDKIIQTDSVKIRYPKKYARALGNKAWSLFKNDEKEQVPALLIKALKIRKKENDQAGLTINYLRFAAFYLEKKQLVKAKENAIKALEIANQIHIPKNRLEAFLLLAKSDTKNATTYFIEYKKLQDSLIKRERHFKDQTAKIRYETKLKEEELVKQKSLLDKRKRSLIIGTFFSFLLVLSALLFWFQKIKIKKQYVVLDTKNTEINNQNILLDKQHATISELQKELHHRVKNNLTLIDSLIDEVKDEFDNSKFNLKLTDLQNRIESMYNLHTLLYKGTDDLTQIKLNKYVEKLVITIQQSFFKENIEIINDINPSFKLPVGRAFHVGLIINEFLTNSYKYAFSENEKGIIKIDIIELPDSFLLSLVDNGKGLPKDFDLNSITSFGMDVMQLLAKQLQGTFSLNTKKGVSLTIEFPKATI